MVRFVKQSAVEHYAAVVSAPSEDCVSPKLRVEHARHILLGGARQV